MGGGSDFDGKGGGGKSSRIDADTSRLGNGGAFDPSTGDDFASGAGSSARTSVISDAGFVIGRSTAGGGGMSTAATFESGGGNGGRLSGSAFVIDTLIGGGFSSGSCSVFVRFVVSVFGGSTIGVGSGGVWSAAIVFNVSLAACEPVASRAPINTAAQQSTEAVVKSPIWVLRVTFRVPPCVRARPPDTAGGLSSFSYS
jgi:hypothetical protein